MIGGDNLQELSKDFRIVFPTDMIFGEGKRKTLGEKLEEYEIERPLIVTDKGIKQAGIFEKIRPQLENVDYEIYDGVEPNPKDVHVEEGAEIAESFDPDGLIAVGGGSSIDCAKAIGVLYSENSKSIDGYYGEGNVKAELPPFIALPTTSGTGSEITFSAVITDTDQDRKRSVRSEKSVPDVAILDPELTRTLPKELTAFSGMDAFTHSLEAYTAKTANPISNALALYSMELIIDNLPTVVEEPYDLEARSNMLVASSMAGMAFNHSDVASVHCMAEALGGKYDAPHGMCNSIILPYMMEYNKSYCPEKYAKIAERMGYDFVDASEGAEKAVKGIKKMNEELGIPSIHETALKKEDIEELAKISAENLSNESNPRPMSKEDYVGLFEKMLND